MDKNLLLQYARAYDLVEDYTSISPISFICLPFDIDDEATDVSTILSCLSNALPTDKLADKKDRLEASKEVSTLLAKTISLRRQQSLEDLYPRWNSLRIDEPLLQYSATLPLPKKMLLAKANPRKIQFEPVLVSQERDEGLEFPTSAWDLRNEIIQDTANDRMMVERKTLEFLKWAVRVPETKEELSPGRDFDYETDSNLSSLTPPLSPMRLPSTPLSSPPPIGRIAESLELLSDRDDTPELKMQLEQTLLKNDGVQQTPRGGDRLQHVVQPGLLTPSPAKRPYEDYHVDVPLTPPMHTAQKKVKFSEVVEEIELPPSIDPSDDEESSPYDESKRYEVLADPPFAEFTEEILEPGALWFLRNMRQEEVNDLPNPVSEESLRVELPKMKWKRPVPPWVAGRSMVDSIEVEMDEEVTKEWEYKKSIDISGLEWVLLPEINITDLEEASILDENEEQASGYIDQYLLKEVEDEILSQSKIEVQPEFSTDEDEDLGYVELEPKMDLDSIVERCKRKLDAALAATATVEEPAATREKEIPADQLSSFLFLQNQDFTPPPSTSTSPNRSILSSDPPVGKTPSQPTPKSSPLKQSSPQSLITSQALPVPPDPLGTFIVSPSFMRSRSAYRSIRQLCPKSSFLERELRGLPETREREDGKDAPPPKPLPEADILISPLVGLIVTNLQTVRQRHIPGLSIENSDGIRERILSLSGRYKELLVGITIEFSHILQGEDGQAQLGRADSSAVAAFTGYCQVLGNIQTSVIFDVSGEETGKWAVEAMGTYTKLWREIGYDFKLYDKESQWESFLRIGGFNSYAAQAILRKLEDSGCHLIDFVSIERESRREIFEELVGGNTLEGFEVALELAW